MSIDKILAATVAINMMANDLQAIAKEKCGAGLPMSSFIDDTMQLQQTANALRDVVENLGNYIDSHDAQNEYTLTALNALLDIVYERTKGGKEEG